MKKTTTKIWTISRTGTYRLTIVKKRDTMGFLHFLTDYLKDKTLVKVFQ